MAEMKKTQNERCILILPKTKRILCLDDKEVDLEAVIFMPKQINPTFEVTTLDNANSTITTIASQNFHLYILDFRLEETSGLELCRLIRVDDPETPIMFLMGMVGDEYRKAAKEAGADSYIVKPVDFELKANQVNPI